MEIISYIANNTLFKDTNHAQQLALTRSQYAVIDDVLYFVENKTAGDSYSFFLPSTL